MLKFVVLLATLATLDTASGYLKFYYNQNGNALNVTCHENGTQSDFQFITSMVISKYTIPTQLASMNIFSAVDNSFPEANVSGQVNTYYTATLTVHWDNAKYSDNGDYTCTLYGLDQRNMPISVSSDMTLTLSDQDPILSVTPEHIVEGLTQSLVVECSLASLASYDMTEMTKLEIFHNYNGTDELIFSSERNLTGWTLLNPYYYWSLQRYYEISKQNPTVNDSGSYSCDITYSTIFRPDLHIVKMVDVTASVLTLQEEHSILSNADALQGYFVFVCDFESGLCGMKVTLSGSGGWRITQSRMLPGPLHRTIQSKPGHYMYVYPSELNRSGDRYSTVETRIIMPRERPICISLWYSVSSNGLSNLWVYNRKNDNSYATNSINVFKSNVTMPWIYVKVKLPSLNVPFVVGIRSDFEYSPPVALLAIDDIAVSDINCD